LSKIRCKTPLATPPTQLDSPTPNPKLVLSDADRYRGFSLLQRQSYQLLMITRRSCKEFFTS
ncbi:MAG: hypothetical protein MUF72_16455, partial [Elainella sp. Prado103]|nr:hypothetical protein [Elainella sp. Prado103]